MKRPSIALVDDEPGVRKGLSRLLRAANLDAQPYGSAEEFLHACAEHPPDCVIVDLQMPGVSGLDVQARLKAAGARVPVIIVTGRDEPEAYRRCAALGAVAYLRKPLDGEELLDVIRAALDAQHT